MGQPGHVKGERCHILNAYIKVPCLPRVVKSDLLPKNAILPMLEKL